MSQPDPSAQDSPLARLMRGENTWITVQGGSMTPILYSGDRVLVTPDRVSRLHPGQLVLAVFNTGQFVVHRVVHQSEASVILRGDACPAADPPLTRTQVLGIVAQARRGKLRIPLGSSGVQGRLWSGVLRLRQRWQGLRRRS